MFKQGKQIFLWADVDKNSEKEGVKSKEMFKLSKVFLNEPAKIKVLVSIIVRQLHIDIVHTLPRNHTSCF